MFFHIHASTKGRFRYILLIGKFRIKKWRKWQIKLRNKNGNWNGTLLDYLTLHKNIERHTADTIVSWPNPKRLVIVHTSDLMMIIRQSIYTLSIITREMDKLKTYSPTYCIMDNGENMLNLTHTLDNIFHDRHFISSMPSDKFAQWWKLDGVLYKQTSTSQNVSEYLHSSYAAQ